MTVLRDGAVVGSREVTEVDTAGLVGMMVGRSLSDIYPTRSRRPGQIALEVQGLSRPGVLESVDLDVRAGECVFLVVKTVRYDQATTQRDKLSETLRTLGDDLERMAAGQGAGSGLATDLAREVSDRARAFASTACTSTSARAAAPMATAPLPHPRSRIRSPS